MLFTGFTDIAMTFEARGFLADINNGATVRNDIRFAMLDAFKENGIQLAFTLKPEPLVDVEAERDLDNGIPKADP